MSTRPFVKEKKNEGTVFLKAAKTFLDQNKDNTFTVGLGDEQGAFEAIQINSNNSKIYRNLVPT